MKYKYIIGDEIKIEKSPNLMWPRWVWSNSTLIDSGYSGKYFEGSIDATGANFVSVNLGEPNKKWTIPIEGHYSFMEGQWDLPGFFENLSYQTRQRKLNGCSCGAWNLYGEDWDEHDSSCSYYDLTKRLDDEPSNNDGRSVCWNCKRPTINVSFYQLCNNIKCEWYKK